MAFKKPAQTCQPIHQLIAQRWSPRAYSDQPVPNAKLLSLFEAAAWSASCFNQQPWRFIVATKQDHPEVYDKLFNCLVDANKAWANKAPVLMLAVSKMTFNNGNHNFHAFYDTGQAMANLSIEAVNQGLWVHQMAGFDPEKARQAFNFDDDFNPIAMATIGYQGDVETLPEQLRELEKAPRGRNFLGDFVFTEEWGKESSIFDEFK